MGDMENDPKKKDADKSIELLVFHIPTIILFLQLQIIFYWHCYISNHLESFHLAVS